MAVKKNLPLIVSSALVFPLAAAVFLVLPIGGLYVLVSNALAPATPAQSTAPVNQ